MSTLAALEGAIADLGKRKEEMFAALEEYGWPRDPPPRMIPGRDTSMEFLDIGIRVPERRALPPTISVDYQRWHNACRAILTKNQPDRLDEFLAIYSQPKSIGGIRILLAKQHVGVAEQFDLMAMIDQQHALLVAVPDFLRSSMYDIELTAYAVLMDDELEAARHLVSRGFNRAAGAMAGVVLERHLKNLLRKHVPLIKVPATASLGKLNDACKGAVYDVPTWRKVQHLTDVRNLCDHDQGREPTRAEMDSFMTDLASVVRMTSPRPEAEPLTEVARE